MSTHGTPYGRARLTLKTYSHLAGARRIPSEYDIATSRLLYYPPRGFEVNVPLREWYARHQAGSPFTCSDWEKFCDPRETTYARYTGLQRGREAFVDGVLRYAEETRSDEGLSEEWIAALSRLVAPLPFPFHGFAMIAAYVGQMAPSGRITVAAMFQAADEVRRLQRIAYRTRELQLARPGFGEDRRARWQDDPMWQQLREAVERLLVAYDWGEALVGLNLVLKPLMDELLMNHLGRWAEQRGDRLLRELFFSFDEDCRWHREWTAALVTTALEDHPANQEVVQRWIEKWLPLAERAARSLAPMCAGDAAELEAELRRGHAVYLGQLGPKRPPVGGRANP
jgi:toluene monooxygenase system protein E